MYIHNAKRLLVFYSIKQKRIKKIVSKIVRSKYKIKNKFS